MSTVLGHKLATWTQQTLRSFRLLIIMAVGPWKQKKEQSKIALYTGWVPVLTGLLVHILPLAACIALIYLNLASYYVGSHVSTLTFQFLAKFLELLAQASLGRAVFVYLRALYTGSESVPFGALFAGLQITSVSYLWSLEFAGVVTSKNFKRTRKFVFLLVIPLSIALGVGIGPSFAIALTPTLGNFYDGWGEGWIDATEEQLFPSHLNSTDPVYNFSNNCSTGDCARHGWENAITIAHAAQQSTGSYQGSLFLMQDALPYREIRCNASSGYYFLSATVTVPSKVIAWSLVRLVQQAYRETYLSWAAEVHNFTTSSRQPAGTVYCTPGQWLNSTTIYGPSSGDFDTEHRHFLQSESLRSLNDTESLDWVFIDRSSQLDPSVWVFLRFPPGNSAAYLGPFRPFGLRAIDVSSYGYGYQIDQTTKIIAISVLAAYCLYILIFVVLVLTLNRVHSNAWDSIGELTALAIMSRPDDKLRNTSAGIETVALFELPMNIRANDNNHLEILFEDDGENPSSGVVEKNKKYN